MLRVATLNLLHSTYALNERLSALVEELRDANLDFLLLQEVLPGPTVDDLADALDLPHTLFEKAPTRKSGNAILSRHELTAGTVRGAFNGPTPAVGHTFIDGREVIVISHHGAWGPDALHERVQEVRAIDAYARHTFTRDGQHLGTDTRPIIILGGDFNAVPDSAPIRYLTGLDTAGESSTLWVDAAAHAGDTGNTSGTPTTLSIATAAGCPGAPYRPERTPLRRIDYLFVYEWCYGQAGEPVAGRRFATHQFLGPDGDLLTVSDHYGVMADLWTP